MRRCYGDHLFGPTLRPGTGCNHFDFTVLFEESIFNLAPSALVALAALNRTQGLFNRPRVISRPILRSLKLTAFVVLAAFQASLLALSASGRGRGHRTRVTVPASAVNLASILILAALSDLEHRCMISPSVIVQTFLFFTSLLDIARVRTQWLLNDNAAPAALLTAALVVRISILLLESRKKWQVNLSTTTKNGAAAFSPRETCGIFGHTLLLWLNPLFALGYKRDLSVDDLPPLDSDLDSRLLTDRLLNTWADVNKSRKHALRWAMLITFLPEVVMAWIPRAASIGFYIAQPFLVKKTLEYIRNHSVLPLAYGYGLTGAYGIVYTGVAITNLFFFFLTYRLMVKMRGSLVGIIYHDMLALRIESGGNASAAMSLMGSDVDTIVLATRWVIDIIPNLTQVSLALWILNLQLGAVCVAPVIVSLLCALVGGWLGKLMPPRQRQWMQAIQKRVGITSDMLSAMKAIKMTALSDIIGEQIQGQRDFELSESMRLRRISIWNAMMNTIPVLSMQAVTFTAFTIVSVVSGGGTIGITQAFTSVSLLQILVVPVITLVTSFARIASATSSLDRIQEFLLKDKQADCRTAPWFAKASEERSFHSGASDERQGSSLIRVANATFSWSRETDKPCLTDVSLDILPGSLTLVVGPVASGKSTLLKSFLRETYLLSGSVHFADMESVAFCDQDAWVLNLSIKDNILGFSEYSDSLYKNVVRACQLETDLRLFPDGDNTVVGSQGMSLSGGQKARVALARAIYSQKRTIISDDTMKGLDADTASKCFRALFWPGGLLRKGGVTVIMATHKAQWFQYADQLIVLNENRRIASSGHFADLQHSDEYIRSLCIPPSHYEDINDAEEEEGAIWDDLSEPQSSCAPSAISEKAESADMPAIAISEKEVEPVERSSSSIAMCEQKSETPEPSTTIAAAQHKGTESRGKRYQGALVYYMRSLDRVWFVVFLCLLVLNIGCHAIQPLWLKFWASANEKSPNESQGKWVGIYCLFSGLNLTFMCFQFCVYLLRIVPQSAISLHWKVLQATMRAPLSYFIATDVGEIVNRFSQDMALIDFPLPMAFMMALEYTVQTVADLLLTCISSGYLAVAVPFLLAVLFCIQSVYMHTSRQLRLLELECKSPLYSFSLSSFVGLASIRAFSWGPQCFQQFLRLLDTSQRPYYTLFCAQSWLAMVLELALAGLCVLLVGISVALRDRIDVGLAGVALTSVVNFGLTLTQLIRFWTELETSLGAVTRIAQFQADTPQEIEGPDTPPPNWPARGAISVAGLSATYGERPVLSDVNLEILPGEKVAVCGRSGSGKSTLLALLLRLYEPTGGTISIDGVDISSLRLNSLRKCMATLPQDPFILAGTVRYNLDPASLASDDEILRALDRTGIHAVIEDRGGLGAEFNADWLSAGQKQLFCLARAMLRRSRFLLFDEATSSLDLQTDDLVQRLIREEFAGCTMVVVAHRLKTIADFDKVAVLQEGKVVEFDAPNTLLERGGLFKSLWDQQ